MTVTLPQENETYSRPFIAPLLPVACLPVLFSHASYPLLLQCAHSRLVSFLHPPWLHAEFNTEQEILSTFRMMGTSSQAPTVLGHVSKGSCI
jgi:hypothetical protein